MEWTKGTAPEHQGGLAAAEVSMPGGKRGGLRSTCSKEARSEATGLSVSRNQNILEFC